MFTLAGRDLSGFLDPVDCPALGTMLLPVLHPSYQDAWIARIGHTPDSYREALSAALADAVEA